MPRTQAHAWPAGRAPPPPSSLPPLDGPRRAEHTAVPSSCSFCPWSGWLVSHLTLEVSYKHRFVSNFLCLRRSRKGLNLILLKLCLPSEQWRPSYKTLREEANVCPETPCLASGKTRRRKAQCGENSDTVRPFVSFPAPVLCAPTTVHGRAGWG